MARPIYGVVLVAFIVASMVACSQSETETSNADSVAPATEPAVASEPEAQALKIKSLKFGKSVNKDQKIEAHTVAFAPSEPVYASVELSGNGSAHLKAVWTHSHGDQSEVVNESEQTLDVSGEAATEFHVAPASGWKTGDYKVEVKLNDTFSEAKTFSVSE